MTSETGNPAAAPPPPPPAAAPGKSAGPAVVERRLHPAATVIVAVRHVRSAGFAALALIASQGLARGGAIVLAISVVAAIAAVIHWRTTRYAVVDGALRLRTGLIARKEQVIPASRISALDTSRGILQRIFGVVAVQVQTAGGKKDAELVLRAVSFFEAERLRHELGHRATSGAPAAPAAPDANDGAATADAAAAAADGRPTFTSPTRLTDDAPVVYAMTPGQLVIAALTSPSVALVGAAAAALMSFASDALPDSLNHRLSMAASDLTVTAVVTLIVLGLVLAAIVSVAGKIVLYGGFRVTRDDRRLRVQRGLLTERVGTIPLDRIHGVRIYESPLRQLLGYASIEAEVAGYAGQDEITRTLVPLVRRSELPAVLAAVVPGLPWSDPELERVPRRARRRYVTRSLMFAAPAAIALTAAPIGHARLLALLPLLIAIPYGWLAARDAGWALVDGALTMRARALGRVTLIASERRLQRAERSTSPWQRRAALATLGVRLSSARHFRVRHLDEAVAHDLLARTGQ